MHVVQYNILKKYPICSRCFNSVYLRANRLLCAGEGCIPLIPHVDLPQLRSFYPRDAMLARVLAMAPCPCLCLSVTSRCSIETDRRNNLVLAWGLLSTSPTLYFMEIQVSTKIRVLPSGTFFLNSGLRKFRHGISIVERAINLARERWSL